MTAHVLIACRMGSSRFPGKTIAPLLGKPMIERMVERVGRARRINGVTICTSTLPEDETLADLASRMGIGCFRGSPEDVLDRVNSAAQTVPDDLIIELLGDNPLVHSDLIDAVVDFHLAQDCDYTASVTTEYPHAGPGVPKFPVGVRVQAFPKKTLARAAREAINSYHRENSTTYIYEHPDRFRLGYLEATGTWTAVARPELTFAVNFRENHQLVSRIFDRCYPNNPNFSLHDAVMAFDADPSLKPLMGNR